MLIVGLLITIMQKFVHDSLLIHRPVPKGVQEVRATPAPSHLSPLPLPQPALGPIYATECSRY